MAVQMIPLAVMALIAAAQAGMQAYQGVQAKSQAEKNREAQAQAAALASDVDPFAGGGNFFTGYDEPNSPSGFVGSPTVAVPQGGGGPNPWMGAVGSIVSSPYMQQLYGMINQQHTQTNPYLATTAAGPYMSYMDPTYGQMINTGTSSLGW